MPPSDTQVLIAGAGPTGLLLAIYLVRHGVRVRIVDKAAEPGTTSRALVVHARTLELYRQLGLDGAVIQRALRMEHAHLWVSGRRVGHIVFGEMGRGLSPYPYAYIYPQDEHERMLIAHLESLGTRVERGVELTSVTDDGTMARAVLSRDENEERCAVAYVAGCDGAHSRVRSALSVGFPGGTYEHVFYVADVTGSGPVVDDRLHIVLDDADFLGVFPLRDQGHLRLIGSVRDELARKGNALEWGDVSRRVIDRMRVQVDDVHWFSTYHVHHRVANHFRAGRVFLLGDAAHIHSPVGGQGMNTGLGDAANLGWKLAAVIAGRASEQLLDTYEPERIAFARALVGSTDRAFTIVTSTGPLARRVRLHVVPVAIPLIFRFGAVRRRMFRTISQIGIHSRESPLSSGRAGHVRGGDRLPWVPSASSRESDNHAPLTSLDWQVHVYGRLSPPLRELCRAHALPVHEFGWSAATRRVGLQRDAAYLVRPDGYVAAAVPPTQPWLLEDSLAQWRITTRGRAT
jgi:2-polyprenyl-6-methoxyphenol hydroxylase-like FAD-dependent oxidoreductase